MLLGVVAKAPFDRHVESHGVEELHTSIVWTTNLNVKRMINIVVEYVLAEQNRGC